MLRMNLLRIALVVPVVALATLLAKDLAQGQAPTPSVPRPSTRPERPDRDRTVYSPTSTTVVAGGYYPGYNYGGGTVAGNALTGLGNAIGAAGDYNLSTSQAAINMTQAQRNEIENRQLNTEAYFNMRATNRAARAAEARPRATEEQLVRLAREGIPKALSASDVEPVSGKIAWPSLLQGGDYDENRNAIDELFAKQASHGSLGYSDQQKVREALEGMLGTLKQQVRDIPPPDYLASKNFLRGLGYTTTRTDL